VPVIAGVVPSFYCHKAPAISFVRYCSLSVDVVNIIDQNHSSAVLPTWKGPVVSVDEAAKLAPEPVWVLQRRAECFPLPDSEHDSFFSYVPKSQRRNVS